MFYFQLLRGVHAEGSIRYEATPIKDDEGKVIDFKKPVVKAYRDLVAAFGSEKFRRISEREANALMAVEKASELGDTGSDENSSEGTKAHAMDAD